MGTPGPCGAWWGGTLAGVTGAATCPCPGSPQFLAYGQTQFSECWSVSGPFGARLENEIVSCSYHFDESRCPTGGASDEWVKLPYFGGGTGKLTFSSLSAAAGQAACAAPRGGVVPTGTYAQQASRLVGVWVVCTKGLGVPFEHPGLALHPDGSFEALDVDADHFLPASGCQTSGLWGLDTGQANQLDLFADAGDYLTLVTVYSGVAPQLSVDNEGTVALLSLIQ
jgi:hypothetical protein